MARRKRSGGGTIAGPGGPRDKHGVVIDSTNAVLLDACHVAMIETSSGGMRNESPALAMTLSGRINRTTDLTEILYIFDEDGAAAIITELLALGSRIGPAFEQRLWDRIDQLQATDGALGPADGST